MPRQCLRTRTRRRWCCCEQIRPQQHRGSGAALADVHSKAFDTGLATLPLPELVDRVVRPMIEVNVANPGVKTIFTAADMPDHVDAGLRVAARHHRVGERGGPGALGRRTEAGAGRLPRRAGVLSSHH
ncbi:hypothetical protein [Actinophytocola glycyrrhizae]|uniref:Uncharacterized protein n=1 Tax=Actinophytocola glycyrrhizae TaxID=2044873 RepID=A0ABV9RTD5_9PSEU